LATRRNRTQVAPQDAAEEAPYSFVLETGFSLAGVTLYYAGLNNTRWRRDGFGFPDEFGDRRDENVAGARDGFDVAWLVGGVAQRGAEAFDGGIEAAIEIDKGLRAPEAVLQLLPCDNRSLPLYQRFQNFERLALQLEPDAMFAEYARGTGSLKFERTEDVDPHPHAF